MTNAATVTLFLATMLFAHSQPIMPPFTVDPLDMSGVQLLNNPQQLPSDVWLSWNNLPIQIAAHTDVCGSFDLQHIGNPLPQFQIGAITSISAVTVDEVRLYNRALTTNEIIGIYHLTQ